MPKSKKPKTHFEQVSLEIVKRIAAEEISSDETNGDEVAMDTPAKKRAVYPVRGQPR
jgi:hypothetical protein